MEHVSDIWILTMEDDAIEVFAAIEGIDASNPVVTRALLEANYLGMATGAARVGVDPFTNQVTLCERWTVEQLLHPDARQNLLAFAGLVDGWRRDGVETIVAYAKNGDQMTSEPFETMITV